MYVCMYVCVYLYVCMRVYVFMCVYVWVCLIVCACVCVKWVDYGNSCDFQVPINKVAVGQTVSYVVEMHKWYNSCKLHKLSTKVLTYSIIYLISLNSDLFPIICQNN